MPRIIPPFLGVVGGFIGIAYSVYIFFVVAMISILVGGEPDSSFLLSVLGMFVGAGPRPHRGVGVVGKSEDRRGSSSRRWHTGLSLRDLQDLS